MKISFKKSQGALAGTVVVFALETGKGKKKKPELTGAGKALDKQTGGQISRAMEGAAYSAGEGALLEILAPAKLAKVERIIVAGLGKPEKFGAVEFSKAGGALARRYAVEKGPEKIITLLDGLPENIACAPEEAAARLGFGAMLGAYRFDLYKSKAKPARLKGVEIVLPASAKAQKLYDALAARAEGVAIARDLVHEPANVLFPAEFAARLKKLSAKGLKVEVLREKDLEKLGMGALLGVGQASVRESHVVVMQWNGGKKGQKPVAFIGKGVCFDTGGISLKPAPNMEDMKADMGGAACVSGLMAALAGRKAKVNAVGVVGLVENMPGGNAQRPGDIVTAMSGTKIEVLNTDAEGRLVLADVLHYAQKRFEPQAVIDLATLTGAIIIALGQTYAGLFANDDALAQQLLECGQREGERLWRLPLDKEYDKLIDSKTADVKNIGGGRNAGSITAAQFLQRFIKKGQPWAHIDIAGVAMGTPPSALSPAWGSGFGVRLLDDFVNRYYEQ